MALSDRFVLSRFIQFLPFDSYTVVANGMTLRRMVVDREIDQVLRFFADGPVTRAEFVEALGGDEAAAEGFLRFFRNAGFIVEADSDEPKAVHDLLKLDVLARAGAGGIVQDDSRETMYGTPARLDQAMLRQARGHSELDPLRIALIGGCVLQVLGETLRGVGLEHGFFIDVRYAWPDGQKSFEAIADPAPDVIVFQRAIRALVAPLLDHAVTIDEAERQARAELIATRIEGELSLLARLFPSSLILVHNVALPQYSPFGRWDFRAGFRELLGELNRTIARAVCAHPNMMLLDEEALFARLGKAALLDDDYMAFSHRGGRAVFSSESSDVPLDAFTPEFALALSREYLAAIVAARGLRRIKCIVTDLDNTLWPGVAGEEGFSWRFGSSTLGGHFEGLHQALLIMKARGVLLATCSKNDEAYVLSTWEALARNASGIALRPQDFVVHRINWQAKTINLQEIAQALGVGLDSILFIDDNEVERAAVRASLPEVRVLGEDMRTVRRALLDDPCLDVLPTAEARGRNDQMRQQLRREEARAAAFDEDAFLRGLDIRLRVRRAEADDVWRVAELCQRTNQFNTTRRRLTAAEVHELLGSERDHLWVLDVEDRFSSYGLTGVLWLRGAHIELLALSCRVIGLRVAGAFLATAIGRRREALPGAITAHVIHAPRNEPCRSVYADAGFQFLGEDGDVYRYELAPGSHPVPVDGTIHHVT
ncbi:MAG TPA: HAD-IIIC family phosphatase [Polyangia bacterium]|jgi:FkbH-like protein|nr:HAD-IIIC family phosphatase [Polyangia bacterium]